MKKINQKNRFFNQKTLTQAVAVGLLAVVSAAAFADDDTNANGKQKVERNSPNYGTDIQKFQRIGDLEIYQAAQAGTVTMTMMLDISGSMTACVNPVGASYSVGVQSSWLEEGNRSKIGDLKGFQKIEHYNFTDSSGKPIATIKGENGESIDVSKGFDVVMDYCKVAEQGKGVASTPNPHGFGYGDKMGSRTRMSELKHAVISIFADGSKLRSDFKVGIGTFPARGKIDSGAIVVPAKELTPEHRYRIIREVMGITELGATPSSHAYSEVGAYMLGGATANITSTEKKTGYVALAKLSQDPNTKHWQVNNCEWTGAGNLGRVGTLEYPRINHGQTYLPTVLSNSTFAFSKAGWLGCEGYWEGYSGSQGQGVNIFRFLSDRPIGDTDYLDYAALGWNKSNSPLSLAATATNSKGLDFGMMGKYDAIFNTKTNQITPIVNGMNPNMPLTSGTVYLLGKKVEYANETTNNDSSLSIAPKDAKNDALTKYTSPLGAEGLSKCDGAGIYFLTDGFPNSTREPYKAMAQSLGLSATTEADAKRQIVSRSGNKNDLETTFVPRPNRPTSGDTSQGVESNVSGWDAIGAYAAILADTNKSGKPVAIKTATLGFGGLFTAQTPKKQAQLFTNPDGTVEELVDCNSYGQADVRNLCKLGEKNYGYGGGGFTATSDAQAVADSIIRFAGSLTNAISTQPAGTISVPKDPLTINSIQPYAYLPMLSPEVAKSPALWKGNLKKYHTLNGTLYSKDAKTRLYVTAEKAGKTPTNENKGYPSEFNADSKDIWQANDRADGSKIDVGGTYESIQNIKSDITKGSRSVYLESKDDNDKTILVKVQINGSGDLVGFDDLDDRYDLDDKIYLVNYLGVQISTEDSKKPANDAALKQAVKAAIKAGEFNDTLLGGVVHSVPVLATYRGEFEEDGSVTSDEAKRQDHLLYGSTDGALHLVEASSGKETFAFIPRAMFDDTNQRRAMLINSSGKAPGSPEFGVDAPWVTHAEYVYDFGNKNGAEVRAEKMYAFGGLRMGGNGFYGLNIKDRNKPVINFSIDKSTDGFSRMGQIWSKPTITKIRVSTEGKRAAQYKDVLVFGGGYDMCYEHPLFKLSTPSNPTNDPLLGYIEENNAKKYGQVLSNEHANCTQSVAMGSAVYMIDLETGKQIARWQSGEGNDDRQHMRHSIVGEIATLDSNNNGATDHLYFADLGGQVFRVDLREGVTGNSMTHRVVRVLDANGDNQSQGNADHINFRFYEKPLVSFHDHNGANGKQSFAVVNIASGDRSSPVHTHRTTKNANRIFGFYDRDLTTNKLDRTGFNEGRLLTRNITTDQLLQIDTKKVETGSETAESIVKELQKAVESTKVSESNGVKQGWYYDMIRFDGRINVSGLKSMGTGTVLGSIYYANVYSPNFDYTTGSSCSARVSGGTERQLYCLPWGICADTTKSPITLAETTKNGTLGYIKAGPGIQDLTVGTVTNTPNKSGAFKAILGHQMLSEVITDSKKQQENKTTGGDVTSSLGRLPSQSVNEVDQGAGSGADIYGNLPPLAQNYTLAVQRWYDLQNENQANN